MRLNGCQSTHACFPSSDASFSSAFASSASAPVLRRGLPAGRRRRDWLGRLGQRFQFLLVHGRHRLRRGGGAPAQRPAAR